MKKQREPKMLSYNGWRKRYKCKRNKGDHTFVLVFARPMIVFDKDMEYYECTACGKQDIKW